MELKTEVFFRNSIDSSRQSCRDKKIAGYSCSYIPEELIAAADYIPYRIYGNKESNLADKYFPINFCPYVKAVWEEIHHNGDMDALVLATSCDGMRRLNDYVSYYEEKLPAFMLDIPRKSDKNSIRFFARNLEKLWFFLCKNNNIDPKDLPRIEEATRIINRKRILLKELAAYYEDENFQLIKNTDYFNIINISLGSQAVIFNKELEAYIEKIKSLKENTDKGNRSNKDFIKVMITGNYINDENFWSIFENINARLISSDICINYRYFDIKSAENKAMSGKNALFDDIAHSYMSKPACFRMAGISSKLNGLKKQISDNNIRGVIFASLKFCDNTLYSFPALKDELNRMKIPSIFLDIEYGKSSYGQLKTRIEAFIEMLDL